jgi:hypothetical protein
VVDEAMRTFGAAAAERRIGLLVVLLLSSIDSRWGRALGQAQQLPPTSKSVDVIPIKDFDVQIAVIENRGIQQHEVSIIVTEWLNDSYRKSLTEFGYTVENGYAAFDSVGLRYNTAADGGAGDGATRRRLRTRHTIGQEQRDLQGGVLYTAKFTGGVVFSKYNGGGAVAEGTVKSVPENDVLYIQQLTLFDDQALADRLRASEYETLGDQVLYATAFLNAVAVPVEEEPRRSRLEGVIIGAIVVAGIAFLFLLAAVTWAYRLETKQDAYKVNGMRGGNSSKKQRLAASNEMDKTDTDTMLDETPEKMPPPMVIQDDDPHYPDSVISDSMVSGSVVSEDVSASLSQYYRSGMGSSNNSQKNQYRSSMLSDAGSVSSMESYGYSIDAGVMPLPTEVSLGGSDSGNRIGGLPIEPPGLDGGLETDEESSAQDVNLPDLNKELGHLMDINLTSMDDVSAADDNSFEFSNQDNPDDILSDVESRVDPVLEQRRKIDG